MMNLFFRSYGTKDELLESYRSYMPQNRRDKLNTTAHNSANSELIDEDASDKGEVGVDEPDIFVGSEDNEDEDGWERQDTPPAEINNASALQEIKDLVSEALLENNGGEDPDKEDYETEDTGAESPHCFGGEHTASFNAFKKVLRCDSLTNITERDLEACATLEMK